MLDLAGDDLRNVTGRSAEDVATRFLACGWNVTRVGDANDLEMLDRAFETFRHTHDRPTLIIVDSHIAYGAPTKQDTSAAHGEPLGDDEIRRTKRVYGWPEEAKFLVPDEVRQHFREGIGARGRAAREAWAAAFETHRQQYPELAEEIERIQARRMPDGWDAALPVFPADPKGVAGREASAAVLNAIAAHVPWLLGGSADLTHVRRAGELRARGVHHVDAGTSGGVWGAERGCPDRPHFGTKRWDRFDLAGALAKRLGKPVRLINDAEMQGLAVIKGKGLELVVTLGTGVGTALFRDGELMPHLELAHHPVRGRKTYNEYVGDRARKKLGGRRWNRRVRRVVDILQTLLNYDRLDIGGGNARRVTFDLDRNMRLVSNDAGMLGGIALWRKA